MENNIAGVYSLDASLDEDGDLMCFLNLNSDRTITSPDGAELGGHPFPVERYTQASKHHVLCMLAFDIILHCCAHGSLTDTGLKLETHCHEDCLINSSMWAE